MRNLIALEPAGVKERDVTLTPEQATRLSLPVQFVALGFFLILHHLVWHQMPMQLHSALSMIRFVLAFGVGILAHEGLHGLGYILFGGVGWQAVKFGVHWRTFMPYTHCREPLTARAYRLAIGLPGLVLGILPAMLGVALDIGWLTVWGSVLFAAASGDMLILWVIRRVPGKARVRDHPHNVGCAILLDP